VTARPHALDLVCAGSAGYVTMPSGLVLPASAAEKVLRQMRRPKAREEAPAADLFGAGA
jgi:hypothetical protein